MKHLSLPFPRWASVVVWATFLLLASVCTQVHAQQSTLPCNSTTSTPFENGSGGAFSGLTQNTDETGLSFWTSCPIIGSCANTPIPARVVDGDLSNFARGNILATGSVSLTVAGPSSQTYNSGNFAGFALRSTLINLNVLSSITVRTYLNGVFQEASTTANILALSTSLLTGSDAYEVGFYTTKPFNQISITFAAAIGLGTVDVYYAVMRGYCSTNTPLACNTPTTLNAPSFPVIVNPDNTGFGGVASIGSITDPDNAISPSTSDAASLAITASVLSSGSFSIKLQNQILNPATNTLDDGYPAGTFAGIDFSNPNLLGVDVSSGIRVRTFYHGSPTGDVAAVGSLFVSGNTSLLTGTGRRTIGLVTTQKFDEIQLTVAGTSVTVGTVLIYGAVVKNLCAATIACNTTYPLNNTTFPTIVDPARTGLTGLLGAAFTIQNQDNVVSSSTTDFAIITNTASAATTASIGVLDPISTYPAGTFAGFALRKVSGLAAASLFSRISITTYLDGVAQESRSGGNLLDLSITLFGLTTDYFNAGFVTTKPFDEIQLNVAPFVDLGLLSGHLDVYGAFIDTRFSLGNGLVCALNTYPDFAVTNKNVPVSGSVKTNDVVPAGTTYGTSPTLVSSPGGSTPSLTMNSDGTYTFNSSTAGVYVYSVPVCVSAVCVSQTLTVTVLDPTVNTNKPVANPDVVSMTGASASPSSVTVNVKANDGPGNPGGILGTPTITGNPTNGVASVDGSGNVIYTPNAGFFGTDVLTYQVCETPGGLCATATVTVSVNPPGANNSTLAADDYISTYQGAAVSGNVKTNDSDPEGNTQTVTAQTTTVPGIGTLVLTSAGSYTFTPVAGATGPVEFTYTTTDNGSPAASANGTLHVLINPFNPNPDFAVTNKSVPVTGSVKTNDVVPVGSTYSTTPTLVSSPGGSTPTLVMTSTGSYTFTTSTPGVYVYDVPVCTPGTPSVCTSQTLTVTVLDPAVTTNNPVANPDFATTTGAPSSPTAITVNIKVNDGPGNPGGALGTPTIPNQPAHGTASIDGSGNLVYTPAAGYYGVDVVTYQICETPSTPACATATVTITVKAPGSPAIVSANDDYVATSGTAVTGNILTNDIGTGLSVSNPGTTTYSSGTLVVTSTGSYTFTPTPGTSGPVDFTYTTCDNNSPSNCASATLHILANQAIPDLTPTIYLPQGNFNTSPNNVRDFVVNIFEANGQSTPPGSVSITISVPTGYTISYNSALTSINVTEGTSNPVAIENPKWTVINNVSSQQLTLKINDGQIIAANATAVLGFTITRTTANSGSVSNITVNVTDDDTKTYDANPLNNVYSRIISGL